VPADWASFAIRNVHVGPVTVDLQYHKTADSIVLETKSTGAGDCWVEFSPAVSLRAEVVGVELNGQRLPFRVQSNDGGQNEDQHVSLRFPVLGGPKRVVIRVKNDFGLALSNELPPLGSTSRGLRVISELWNQARTQLTVEVAGLSGMQYDLAAWNPSQISSVDGAVIRQGEVRIEFFAGNGEGPDEEYQHRSVVFHFPKP